MLQDCCKYLSKRQNYYMAHMNLQVYNMVMWRLGNYYMTSLTIQNCYMVLRNHRFCFLIPHKHSPHYTLLYFHPHYWMKPTALNHKNNCYYQCLPGHRLLLLALVPSLPRRLTVKHQCPRDLTRKCSGHTKLIFASSCLIPLASAGYRNTPRDSHQQ